MIAPVKFTAKRAHRGPQLAALIGQLERGEIKGFHVEEDERTYAVMLARRLGVQVRSAVCGDDVKVDGEVFPLISLKEDAT